MPPAPSPRRASCRTTSTKSPARWSEPHRRKLPEVNKSRHEDPQLFYRCLLFRADEGTAT
jgi:hypothetical protein